MTHTLVFAIAAAVGVIALYVLATSRKTAVGGIFKRDNKGRLIFVLTPLKRKRRRW